MCPEVYYGRSCAEVAGEISMCFSFKEKCPLYFSIDFFFFHNARKQLLFKLWLLNQDYSVVNETVIWNKFITSSLCFYKWEIRKCLRLGFFSLWISETSCKPSERKHPKNTVFYNTINITWLNTLTQAINQMNQSFEIRFPIVCVTSG